MTVTTLKTLAKGLLLLVVQEEDGAAAGASPELWMAMNVAMAAECSKSANPS